MKTLLIVFLVLSGLLVSCSFFLFNSSFRHFDSNPGYPPGRIPVQREQPIQVPGIDQVAMIAAGGRTQELPVKADGSLWVVPGHDEITPAVNSGLEDVIAVSAGAANAMLLKSDGTVSTFGWNQERTGARQGDGCTQIKTVLGGLQNLLQHPML